MKVALILSVVAFVAVSQPMFGNNGLPPHPFNACDLIAFDEPMRCCLPQVFGGCNRAPNQPPGQMYPPPDFLQATCCAASHECCVRDRQARFLSYECCDSADGHVCNVADNKGTCIEAVSGNGTTPDNVIHLEAGGQCPHDGSLPIPDPRNGQPIRCSLNVDINAECPNDSTCVRDNTGNVNSGVCCRATTDSDGDAIGCDQYSSCHECVRNENRVNAPCGWLSQGSLSNIQPRCVINCDNFPQKSCIIPSRGEMCPALTNNTNNGTIVNTGTCARRCGYIGTGRAARINNNGNIPPTAPENATVIACCEDYPGDYCCDAFGQRATHCGLGRVPGETLCGVPLRGTPNALYTPANEPMGPYMAQGPTNWPTPYGPFPPMGQPYGYGPHRPTQFPQPYGPQPVPYGPYGPMPYGPGPIPYGPGPMPYGPGPMWRDGLDGEDDSKWLYYNAPPMYYPALPPPMPRRVPPVASINPSPFVCSCDDHCSEYDDCCSDYEEHCDLA